MVGFKEVISKGYVKNLKSSKKLNNIARAIYNNDSSF